MIKVFAPYFEILSVPIFGSLKTIKAAGFDGVEIHLATIGQKRGNELVRHAHDLGLDVTQHQGWSVTEGDPCFENKVLNAMRLLPKDYYSLKQHLLWDEDRLQCPAIIYPDRIREMKKYEDVRVQTYSTFSWLGRYSVPHEEFCRIVKHYNSAIVFDTQHYLEYLWDARQQGVWALPSSRDVLYKHLSAGWEMLCSQTVEIHFNDCSPQTIERNIFPGQGIMPLEEFARIVLASKWSGTVVPEVRQMTLSRPTLRYLKTLRDKTMSYFV